MLDVVCTLSIPLNICAGRVNIDPEGSKPNPNSEVHKRPQLNHGDIRIICVLEKDYCFCYISGHTGEVLLS